MGLLLRLKKSLHIVLKVLRPLAQLLHADRNNEITKADEVRDAMKSDARV